MIRCLTIGFVAIATAPKLAAAEQWSHIISAQEDAPRNSEGDLTVLRDGTLLAAWSQFYGGNRDHAAARIAAIRSTDNGRTWSAPTTLVENDAAQNVMSVSFLRLASGDLLLFYLEKNSSSDLKVVVRRSQDEAKTWADRTVVTSDRGYWVMNNARVIQLPSGRILCPTSMVPTVWKPGNEFRTVCVYSDDDGRTWRRSSGAVAAPRRGAMEPGLIQRRDGSLLQYIRTQTGRQWFATSDDEGDTWSQGRPWTLESPEAPVTVAKLPNGNWMMVGNTNVTPGQSHMGRRTPLVVKTSSDEGRTWSEPKALESDPSLTYSYTSINIHQQRLLLTYYVSDAQNQISWKFRSLPLSWLPAPKAPDRLDQFNLLQFRDAQNTLRQVQSQSDWQQRRQEVLRGMESVMGSLPAPAAAPPSHQVQEQVDAGKYIRRLITYHSDAGTTVPAYLCIPKSPEKQASENAQTPAQSGDETNAAASRRFPAVLCLHPTDAKNGYKVVLGLAGRANRQYAHELAERGFVTLSPAYPHLANYYPNLGQPGYASGTIKAVWDNIRGLDLLESLPEVDSSKGFGVIGHSLGGHNAIFTAVRDERLKVVVSSCGFDAFADYYNGDKKNWYFGRGWCQVRYMPRMSNYREDLAMIPFDFPELLAALAPRHVLISAPQHDDNFRSDSVQRCAQAAEVVYKLHGVAERLRVLHPDCDHDFPQPVREAAYQLMESVLKSPTKVGAHHR